MPIAACIGAWTATVWCHVDKSGVKLYFHCVFNNLGLETPRNDYGII
jgi:hypothetical protein